MDEKQAKLLVKKMLQAAYIAGQHSVNPESLLAISKEKEALDLEDKICELITKSSRPVCPFCGPGDFEHSYSCPMR